MKPTEKSMLFQQEAENTIPLQQEVENSLPIKQDDFEVHDLYRKYRPQTLTDICGQASVVKTIKRWKQQSKVPQVIALFGQTGVGKALPMDTEILTPNGFTKMHDIAVGMFRQAHSWHGLSCAEIAASHFSNQPSEVCFWPRHDRIIGQPGFGTCSNGSSPEFAQQYI